MYLKPMQGNVLYLNPAMNEEDDDDRNHRDNCDCGDCRWCDCCNESVNDCYCGQGCNNCDD